MSPATPRFRSGVARHVDASLEAQQRGGEQYLPVPALEHGPPDFPGEHELAAEVDLEHPVPVGVGMPDGWGAGDSPGVVDQDVHRPRPSGEPPCEGCDGGRVGEVGPQHGAVAAARAHGAGYRSPVRLHVGAHRHDVRPGSGERVGDGQAYSPARAGDHGEGASQVEQRRDVRAQAPASRPGWQSTRIFMTAPPCSSAAKADSARDRGSIREIRAPAGMVPAPTRRTAVSKSAPARIPPARREPGDGIAWRHSAPGPAVSGPVIQGSIGHQPAFAGVYARLGRRAVSGALFTSRGLLGQGLILSPLRARSCNVVCD